jgi:hypothetical protein
MLKLQRFAGNPPEQCGLQGRARAGESPLCPRAALSQTTIRAAMVKMTMRGISVSAAANE